MCKILFLVTIIAVSTTNCVRHEVDPIIIQVCINGWLFDLLGRPVENESNGAQLECGSYPDENL